MDQQIEFPKERQIVPGGKLHVLGLEEIKQRLGERWTRMAPLVRRYFEAALSRKLLPGDTFSAIDEMTYVVLFRNMSLQEAELSCLSIMTDVCNRLFGETGIDVSLRNVVGLVDRAAVNESGDPCRMIAQMLEQNGNERVINASTQPPDSSDRARDSIKVTGAQSDGAEEYISKSRPSFLYRPIWDTTRGVILSYLCQPLPHTLRDFGAYEVSGCYFAAPEEQAELDTLVLRASFTHLQRLRRQGLRLSISVPLHFETLCRPRAWQNYDSARRGIAPQFLRDITFIVYGIERGVPNPRLGLLLPKLSRSARHLMCIVREGETDVARFTNCGVHSVGTCVDGNKPESHWIGRMKALANSAREIGIETFVFGAKTTSLALNFTGAGIRYIEGTAIAPAVAHPRHAFTFEVEDLYENPLSVLDA